MTTSCPVRGCLYTTQRPLGDGVFHLVIDHRWRVAVALAWMERNANIATRQTA